MSAQHINHEDMRLYNLIGHALLHLDKIQNEDIGSLLLMKAVDDLKWRAKAIMDELSRRGEE